MATVLGYWNWMNFAILKLHITQCLLPNLGSIQLPVLDQTWFEDFQDDHRIGHLGYRQNLYVAPMPPIEFQLNPTYCLGGDFVWRFSRWPTWLPSWISKQNDFSNSKSPCAPNASLQVSAQSDLGFEADGFKIFKMATQAASWIANGIILAILCCSDASHQVSAQFNLRFRRKRCLKNFKMAVMAAVLDIRMEQF